MAVVEETPICIVWLRWQKSSRETGFVLGDIHHRLVEHDACVVDEDVELAEVLEGGVKEPLYVAERAYITLDSESTTTRRLDGENGFTGCLVVTRVIDDDSGSVLTEPHGNSPSNPP